MPTLDCIAGGYTETMVCTKLSLLLFLTHFGILISSAMCLPMPFTVLTIASKSASCFKSRVSLMARLRSASLRTEKPFSSNESRTLFSSCCFSFSRCVFFLNGFNVLVNKAYPLRMCVISDVVRVFGSILLYKLVLLFLRCTIVKAD